MPACSHVRRSLHADVAQVPGLVEVARDLVEHPRVPDHETELVAVGLGPHCCRLLGEARLEAAGPAAVADVKGPAGLVLREAPAGPTPCPPPPGPCWRHIAVVCRHLGGVGTVAAGQRHDDAVPRGRGEHLFCGSRRRAVQQRRFAAKRPARCSAAPGPPARSRRGQSGRCLLTTSHGLAGSVRECCDANPAAGEVRRWRRGAGRRRSSPRLDRRRLSRRRCR